MRPWAKQAGMASRNLIFHGSCSRMPSRLVCVRKSPCIKNFIRYCKRRVYRKLRFVKRHKGKDILFEDYWMVIRVKGEREYDFRFCDADTARVNWHVSQF